MNPWAKHILWGMLLLAVASGCTSGQPGDGAGAAIVGQPIGGDVNALPFARVSLDAVNLYGVSDPAGRYVIPGVPAGTYTLRVAKWNTPLVTLPITIDPDQLPTIDLGRIGNATSNSQVTVSWPTLGTGVFSLAGRVLDSAGNGINEVEVLLVYGDGALARTVTDAEGTPAVDGLFSLTGLPDQPVRLIIGQEGLRPFVVENPFESLPQTGDDFTTGDVTLQSVLPAGSDPAIVTVEVRAESDGRLLTGIPVHLSVTDPERPLIDRFGIGGITGSAGRWTFTGIPGGMTYQVWAGSGSFFPETSAVALTAGENRTITLTLPDSGGTEHPYLAD